MNRRVATCSCGQLQLVATGEPIRVSVCHCLACQRRTGSAFGEQARFPIDWVTIQGVATEYIRTADSGRKIPYHFCSTCGATVYYYLIEQPDVIAVPVGAFGDPAFRAPTSTKCDDRKHVWVTMPSDIQHE